MYFKWNKIAKTYSTYGTFCFMEFQNILITKAAVFHNERGKNVSSVEVLLFCFKLDM